MQTEQVRIYFILIYEFGITLDCLIMRNVIGKWAIDVSGINEKFNIGIYYGTEDNFFCIFIGSDFQSYTQNKKGTQIVPPGVLFACP